MKGKRSGSGTGVSPVAKSPVTKSLLITRRNLPHWQQGGSTYFITFRVKQGMLSASERQMVLASLVHWHQRKWHLHAAVVMPDHVHALVHPFPCGDQEWHSLGEILHSVKSFTAHQINKRRKTQGSVWQDERFDRLVRNEAEFQEKLSYIMENPVKAGLAASLEEYPFFWQESSTGETPVPLTWL